MTWNDFAARLKSPVFCWQVVTWIVTGVMAAVSLPAWVYVAWGIVAGVYNLFAGLNNPTNKTGF